LNHGNNTDALVHDCPFHDLPDFVLGGGVGFVRAAQGKTRRQNPFMGHTGCLSCCDALPSGGIADDYHDDVPLFLATMSLTRRFKI
jgi:hypothetical protein